MQQQKNALIAKQIPPLMPPGCDVPILNNANNQVIGGHNNNNFMLNNTNENRNNSGPVPLMSQKINMPAGNMSNMSFPPPASQTRTSFANDDNYENFQVEPFYIFLFNFPAFEEYLFLFFF